VLFSVRTLDRIKELGSLSVTSWGGRKVGKVGGEVSGLLVGSKAIDS